MNFAKLLQNLYGVSTTIALVIIYYMENNNLGLA